MITTNSLIAVVIYVCWRVLLTKDRSDKTDISKTPGVIATLIDLLYTLLMTYLLIVSSSTFILVAFLSLAIHCLFGFYVELFKPEQRLKEIHASLLEKFWNFLLLDTVITIGCFLIINNLGT